MNVFKLAVTIIARHWSYLLIYTLALGCMAILGSGAIEAPQASEFSNDAPKVAVVDRDGSELSAALKDFALKDAVEVHVEDSTFALQDAAAKDLASYVLIIPEGFQEGLVEAAHSGADAPTLETVVSYQGARGALMDQRVKAYVQSLYGFASVDAQASAVMLRTMQRLRAVTRRLWSFFRSIQKAFRRSTSTSLPFRHMRCLPRQRFLSQLVWRRCAKPKCAVVLWWVLYAARVMARRWDSRVCSLRW